MKSTTGLLGYFSPLCVQTNQKTKLKISSNGPETCSVRIYRVICADIDPNGPGQEFQEVDWFTRKELMVRNQSINSGSLGIVSPAPDVHTENSLQISMSIFPTLIKNSGQMILHWGDIFLEINPKQKLSLTVGKHTLVQEKKITLREWIQLNIRLNFAENQIALSSMQTSALKKVSNHTFDDLKIKTVLHPREADPIIFGAQLIRSESGKTIYGKHLNGKIDSPRISSEKAEVLAHWDFTKNIETDVIFDTGPQSRHGKLLNVPMRAATGHNWDGSCHSWKQDPSHFGAIHFHEDDITDCNWQTNLEINVPNNARSGYYIARLESEKVRSDIPFFIECNAKFPRADILFIAPTATYLAYANTHVKFDSHNTENLFEAPIALSEDELYLNENRSLGLSHYDTHSDGSGVIYVSEKRPILNMRPGHYTFNYVNDTHIIKWLENKSISYDIATDEQLHKTGLDLLANYKVVITASHPEYYSTAMWNALYSYQNTGGRHMYLGGNGFYWRIAYSNVFPGVIENRRGASGVRTWEGEPGENHLSFNGELGGLWRTSGRAPQVLVGNGFCATLFLKSTYFRKTLQSKCEELNFVFDGVEDEIFGNFGYRGGGCVGLEIDRHDEVLGSPSNSIVLATSENVGSAGLLTGEEYITTTRSLDGSQHGNVRADMVIFTTDSGGAVWATGSIAWATSLLWNQSENSVSKITENILARFLQPEKIGLPSSSGAKSKS